LTSPIISIVQKVGEGWFGPQIIQNILVSYIVLLCLLCGPCWCMLFTTYWSTGAFRPTQNASVPDLDHLLD